MLKKKPGIHVQPQSTNADHRFSTGSATAIHPLPKDEGLIVIWFKMHMVLETRKGNFGNQQ